MSTPTPSKTKKKPAGQAPDLTTGAEGPSAAPTGATGSPSPRSPRYAEEYNDILRDLCRCVVLGPKAAGTAYAEVLRRVRSSPRARGFQKFRRAWVLSVAIDALTSMPHAPLHPLSSLELSAEAGPPGRGKSGVGPTRRLERFPRFFHCLSVESQLVLLLSIRHSIALDELATAFGRQVASLRLMQTQALLALEEWIWEEDASEVGTT